MSPRPKANATSVARRQSAASPTLSTPVIIGIAVAGAVVLCGALIFAGVLVARASHRRKKEKVQEIELPQDVGKELRAALEMKHPSEWPGRQSYSRIEGEQPRPMPSTWTDDDPFTGPSTPKVRRALKRRTLSPRKPMFRISGMRDSWPLVSTMQIPPHLASTPPPLPLGGLLPFETGDGQSKNEFSQSEPRWPPRTYSRSSRQPRQLLAFDGNDSPETQHFSKLVDELQRTSPRSSNRSSPRKRRSTSESQLSSILRSTSQRLKRGGSLTRARSSISQFPGSPPKEPLPAPPHTEEPLPIGNREKMLTPDPSSYAGSINSSIYERYINRTPSPNRMVARSAGYAPPKRDTSPTHSAASEDSLVRVQTPDLAIPSNLSSPSRKDTSSERRHPISNGAKSEFWGNDNKDRAISAVGGRNSVTAKSGHALRLSFNGDPFYSSAQDSNQPTPSNASGEGLRPYYLRKSTFGAGSDLDRPSSYGSSSTFASPLRDVSGNSQTPSRPRSPPESPTKQNPFHWAPEDSNSSKALQTGLKTSGSRRRGHKRSHTVRISALPRPASVAAVEELPEEESPATAALKPQPLNISAPSSPTRSTTDRTSPFRPPSSAAFNPNVKVPSLSRPTSTTNLTYQQEMNSVLSTLSLSNYYTEEDNSEEEFFKRGEISKKEARRKGYDFSLQAPTLGSFESFADSALMDTESTSKGREGLNLQFSPLISPATTPPKEKAPRSHQSPRGPRNEPPRAGVNMETQISMLRRMNSEVSTLSSIPSPVSEFSPTLPDFRGGGISPSKQGSQLDRRRGSKHYLRLGTRTSPSKRKPKPSIRDSMMRGRVSDKVERERQRRESTLHDEVTQEPESVIEETTIQQKETIMYDPVDFFSGGQLTPMRTPPKASTTKEDQKPVKKEESPKGLNIPSIKDAVLSPTGQSTVHTTPPRTTQSRTTPPRTTSLRTTPTRTTPAHSHAGQSQADNRAETPSQEQSLPRDDEEKRWSDAMAKPNLNGVRSQRDSRMQMPSPKTPPKWAGMGINEALQGETDRPDSLGLYDRDGFLRNSPSRVGGMF
ncbi:hypothetical protein BP6252_02102 [Coleophoma cylindrospora]|uniref:Uncharacterized protein n=1 Tax=Coleophoma cylindrospora TaxID=1849047 RepID=A0A3D8SDW4_9HELO|nr:hypothetical protein BP6252_02102 [Coleophoma cylindrospora]